MMGVLMALGWLLLTLLKIAGVLLLILLVLLALVLLCPLCADVCWEGGVLTVRAGALGLTLPVFQWPAPEKPVESEEPKGFWGKLKAKLRARREERKRKKAAAKEAKRPKKETAPRRKAKLTLNILVTILRGAGRLTKAVFGSLRVTKIRVCLGVRGEDPAEAARAYRAYTLESDGIEDESNWFLPSSGQMLLMYRYRDKINEMMRTFWSSDSMLMTDKYYWSSTIWDNNSAWTFELNTGRITNQNKNSNLLHVRAVASE